MPEGGTDAAAGATVGGTDAGTGDATAGGTDAGMEGITAGGMGNGEGVRCGDVGGKDEVRAERIGAGGLLGKDGALGGREPLGNVSVAAGGAGRSDGVDGLWIRRTRGVGSSSNPSSAGVDCAPPLDSGAGFEAGLIVMIRVGVSVSSTGAGIVSARGL
jgi:hypothetical protein